MTTDRLRADFAATNASVFGPGTPEYPLLQALDGVGFRYGAPSPPDTGRLAIGRDTDHDAALELGRAGWQR